MTEMTAIAAAVGVYEPDPPLSEWIGMTLFVVALILGVIVTAGMWPA